MLLGRPHNNDWETDMFKLRCLAAAMMATLALGLGACVVEEEDPDEFITVDEPDLEEEAVIGTGACSYTSPPRCGPRNCVARCVSCFYDICRASGESCSACKAQMEQCKASC